MQLLVSLLVVQVAEVLEEISWLDGEKLFDFVVFFLLYKNDRISFE
jgi:hypothetical protein